MTSRVLYYTIDNDLLKLERSILEGWDLDEALPFVTSKEAMDLLVRYGANINSVEKEGGTHLLHQLLLEKKYDLFHHAVNLGADINVDKYGPFGLYLTALPYDSMLDFLKDSGYDINNKGPCGFSILVHAVLCEKSYHTIEKLLSLGANPNPPLFDITLGDYVARSSDILLQLIFEPFLSKYRIET